MKLAAAAAVLCASAWIFGTANLCFGQAGSSAQLTGEVKDQSGAVIPGVNIDVEGLATGAHRTTQSNSDGLFSLPVLPPGTYSLTATFKGFTTTVIPSITLHVAQVQTVTVTMHPGVVSQQVTVTTSPTQLQTQTSSLGAVITENTVSQMPLLLLNPTQLVTLVAGVTSDHRQEGATSPGSNLGGLSYQGRLAFEINGGWRDLAVTMVDGVDVTISAGSFLSTPVQPTSEITQEFKVMTTNVPAQYGRGAGVLNIVTKSGTNAFHGSAYEFLQNSDLDANNFFSNRAGQPLPHLERNQFGFDVGGPLWKNKAFFFFDSSWLKQTNADALSTTVPTAAERTGDFSNIYSTNGTPLTIYNPYLTYTGPNGDILRTAFSGNRIPASLITPFTAAVMNYYPQPNTPGLLGRQGQQTGVGNYFIDGNQRSSYDRTDIKLDDYIGTNNHIMARYSRDNYFIRYVNFFNNIATPTSLSTRNNHQPGNNAVLSWTWTISPTLLWTNSINWSRLVDESTSPSFGFDLSKLGGPFANGAIQDFANSYAGGTAFPNITVGGFAPLGDGFGNNFTEPYSNYQYATGIMKSIGKHTISAGFQGILLQAGDNLFTGFGGTFNFSGGFSCGPNPLTCAANTGNGLADLMLNTVDGGAMNAAFASLYSGKYLAWYVQDDFRATSRLTLNLGLRYSITTPFTERHNHEFQLNRTVANPIGSNTGPNTNGESLNQYIQAMSGHPVLGGLAFPNSPGADGRGIVPTDWGNISPRLGVAYRITNKLAFRGGFSKLYFLSTEAPGPSSPGDGPFGATTNIIGTINGISPNVTLDNPFPNGFLTPVYNSEGLESLLGTSFNLGSSQGLTPYQYQWNAGFEYQLGAHSLISASYVGTSTHRLQCPFFSCGNTVAPSLVSKYGSQVVNSVPNPFYGIITSPLAALSSPTVQFGQLLKTWPQYSGLSFVLPGYQGLTKDTFYSNYNALEVQGNTNMHGLTLTAAFTWSKNLTNADSPDGGYLGPTHGYQNEYNFEGEYSLSASDVPYRLAIGYVYQLPFGKGRAIGRTWSGPVNAALGGWQVAGNTTFAGGYPLPISEAGVNTGTFGGTARPNLIGNACYDNGMGRSRSDKITQWLNPAGFASNSNFTLGNAPRELSCRGDGIKNTDLSISKMFDLTERVKVQFRGEFFNIFNRTRLGAPNTTLGSSSFGAVTSILNVPRVIQFGLKVNF